MAKPRSGDSPASAHYDDHYAAWQLPYGEFGGWAALPMFRRFVRPEHNVVDFGCGGGFLLERLECRGKLGVEPNEAAREIAATRAVPVVEGADLIENGWADVVISNHALEHALHPLTELRTLRLKLKPAGRAVFYVPCEGPARRWAPNDINHHLYSWSPMCLGNLFVEAGFDVESVRSVRHKWPPAHRAIAKLGGRVGFETCCRIWGQLARSWCQVRIVAQRG